jgi:hypothetical protein
MAETKYHALEDRKIGIRYVLRLLGVDEARQFETHFAQCDQCAAQLAELTRFFELLRAALAPKTPVNKRVDSDLRAQSEIADEKPVETPASFKVSNKTSAELGNLFNSPENIGSEQLLTIFSNCFAGFQKLRKNISTRIGSNVETTQIEQAAIEILLALPNQVSKIDDN